MPFDPSKRGGWAKGLVHFHTDFSDGKATVRKAAEIATAHGYDFLVITDHLQDVKLKKKRRFGDYIEACDAATRETGILVIPVGEFEDKWRDPKMPDGSEGHTLTLTIRPLVARRELENPDPAAKPYDHWSDSEGGHGKTLAIQEKLRHYNLPVLASHQFMHSLIRYGEGPEHPDFRYDMRYLGNSRAVDFFYSGVVEVAHEGDDFAIYEHLLTRGDQPLPCVYSSCDFHLGPEIWFKGEELDNWNKFLARAAGWFARRKVPFVAEVTMHAYFAPEQLSHATYACVGDRELNEDNLVEAFRNGRTFVTRGTAEVEILKPAPGIDQTAKGITEIRLKMSKSYDFHRPRTVFVLRDGNVVYERVYQQTSQIVDFGWLDDTAEPGLHYYILYIPTKLLTSPMFVER